MNRSSAFAPRISPHVVLASIIGLWLGYFVLATARGWIVGLELNAPLLGRRLAVVVASMAVTAALWPVLRLLDPRPLWLKIAAVLVLALPASLLIAGINQWVFADIQEQVESKIGERGGISIRRDEAGNLLVDPLSQPSPSPTADDLPPAPLPTATSRVPTIAQQEQDGAALTISREESRLTRWRQLTDVALGRYFLLLAWAALYIALASSALARSAERREGEYRRAAKAAELRSLRYQVNPHFLFNTLNSLSALVITGKTEAAEAMIQTLSKFYRRSLTAEPTGDLALDEEIALQKLYLEIEQVRFPQRLRSTWDIPANLAEARVPGMILQPLIENSVKYAVAASRRAVTIKVAAREEFGRLVLEVEDDGPGAPSGAPSHGIGLANVRDRLAARFGEAAGLTSEPGAQGGWRTLIRMPLVRHD